MIATSAPTDGKPRKLLSDQLDRLDAIIDALADALPEAVATAAQDGIRRAFHAVLAEVMADGGTLAALRTALFPPNAQGQSPESATATATADGPNPTSGDKFHAVLNVTIRGRR